MRPGRSARRSRSSGTASSARRRSSWTSPRASPSRPPRRRPPPRGTPSAAGSPPTWRPSRPRRSRAAWRPLPRTPGRCTRGRGPWESSWRGPAAGTRPGRGSRPTGSSRSPPWPTRRNSAPSPCTCSRTPEGSGAHTTAAWRSTGGRTGSDPPPIPSRTSRRGTAISKPPSGSSRGAGGSTSSRPARPTGWCWGRIRALWPQCRRGPKASGLVLRPKAVALTMFVRVCLADVFIHGVSGARYDRVTDRVAQELLGCRPAPYAVATATLHLPLADVHVAEERHALSRRLMDLRHNPDRHLAELTEAHRRLVEEKWALIRALEGMRPGPERRAATRRIREINALLASALAPEIARVEARLRALGEQEALEEVARYREYPFFLFDPGEVAALVGGASREPAESRAGGDGAGPRGRCP